MANGGNRLGITTGLEEQLETALRIIEEKDKIIAAQSERAARQAAELTEAGVDPLTKTGNLNGLERYVASLLKFGQNPRAISVAWLDADGLKARNSEYGMPRGSQSISQAGVVIQKTVGAAGSVFRFGGDDFIVFFVGMSSRVAIDLFPRRPDGFAHLPFEAVLSWEDEKGETDYAKTHLVTMKGAITDWIPGEILAIPGKLEMPTSGTFERLNYGLERARLAGGDQIVRISRKRKLDELLIGEKRKFRVSR